MAVKKTSESGCDSIRKDSIEETRRHRVKLTTH